MATIKVTSANFEETVKAAKKPVLLDFWAPWCGPCRMVSPLVDEIANETDEAVIGKVNVDEEPALASAFGVMSIPTLVVLEDGKVVRQVSGARPKSAILALLKG